MSLLNLILFVQFSDSVCANSAFSISACAIFDKSDSPITFSDSVYYDYAYADSVFPILNSAILSSEGSDFAIFGSINFDHSMISAHHVTSVDFVSIGYDDAVV